MVLTPMEIHNKEFSRSFRGYNEDEVDQFLDQIVEDFERLYKENMDLKDKINVLMDKVSYYKSMEDTLKETLVTAQKSAEEVVANAHKKAEVIIKEAEDKARKIIEEANNDVIKIRKEYEEIKRQIRIFRARFEALLKSQLEIIAKEEDLFQEGESS